MGNDLLIVQHTHGFAAGDHVLVETAHGSGTFEAAEVTAAEPGRLHIAPPLSFAPESGCAVLAMRTES